MDSIQLISIQSSFTKPNSGKLSCISGRSSSTPPRNKELNEASIVFFPSSLEFTLLKMILMKRSSSNLSAMYCHQRTSIVAFCSKVFQTVNTVTVQGTGTSIIFHAIMTPKQAPPPPLMAQNGSSPMDSLSRILPLTSNRQLSVHRSHYQ